MIAAGMALAVAVPSLLLLKTADAVSPAPAKMPVDAADCAATSLTGFGAAPAGELLEGSCRRFTVDTRSPFLARASDADNKTLASAVYSFSGNLVCAVAWCDLTDGTYYLVADPGEPDPRTEPFRATVVDLRGPECAAVTAQGFSTAYRGTFAEQGEVHCLQLPEPVPGRYQVTLQPGEASPPMVQLIQDHNARVCTTLITALSGCEVRVPMPARLIVVVQDPGTSGEYRLALQRTSGFSECADMSPGVPGAPGQATVELSGTDFVTCLNLPPVGSDSGQSFLTLQRVDGDGTASLSAYGFDGIPLCRGETAAAYQQIGCKAGTGGPMVVVRSATGSGKYRISQVTDIGANCPAAVSTAFGGPVTPGSISSSGDVRCHRIAAWSWVGVRDSEITPTIQYRDTTYGDLMTCPALPCMVPAPEVLVSGAKPGTYRLDTWAVGVDFAAPAECAVAAESSYGFGPVTGTMSANDRAHCVSVPAATGNEFRLTVQNAEPYLINGDRTIARCTEGGTTWTCRPQQGRHDRAVVAFIAKEAGPFRAEAECVTLHCGGARFWLADDQRVLPAGTTATFTIRGGSLHQKDTVRLTRDGKDVAPIVVRSVSPGRDFYTVDIDLTEVGPGEYGITATSFGVPGATAVQKLAVQKSQLVVTAKPSISGRVAVGVRVTANPGVWSPAVKDFRYQWYANGAPIPNATGASYTIPTTMRGKRLAVNVTGRRADYMENEATSAALTVAYGVAPKATAAPRIAGTAKVGRTVKVTVGTWSPKATSYRYEWRVNGKLVATAASLKLQKAWTGKKLTLVVIVKRTGHHDGRAAAAGVIIKK